MYRWWMKALAATYFLSTTAADKLESSLVAPRRIIPRPGRIPSSFTPDTPNSPPPLRLGDRPKGTADGDEPLLPKRPVAGHTETGLDAPSRNDRDPYRPPEVPDLSVPPNTAPNGRSTGKADGTYHPCSPFRYDESLCLELMSAGSDLLQELFGPDPEESTSLSTQDLSPSSTTPTVRLGEDSIGAASEPSVTAVPNLNMSQWMAGTKYTDVYTPEEFEFLKSDPLCFFAVYERIYRAYASLAPTATDTISAPKPTANSLDRRQGGIGCHNAPELCKAPEDKARTLYLGYLPDQIHLVYRHTPTEVTVRESGTTTCEGFTLEDQVTVVAFETAYGVFEYREGQSPASTETESPTSTGAGDVEDAAGRTRPPTGALTSWALVVGILSMFF